MSPVGSPLFLIIIMFILQHLSNKGGNCKACIEFKVHLFAILQHRAAQWSCSPLWYTRKYIFYWDEREEPLSLTHWDCITWYHHVCVVNVSFSVMRWLKLWWVKMEMCSYFLRNDSSLFFYRYFLDFKKTNDHVWDLTDNCVAWQLHLLVCCTHYINTVYVAVFPLLQRHILCSRLI